MYICVHMHAKGRWKDKLQSGIHHLRQGGKSYLATGNLDKPFNFSESVFISKQV